ncbi:MAG: tetratricopeptide repeat protein [Candidatus Ratteibacteria bacterium]
MRQFAEVKIANKNMPVILFGLLAASIGLVCSPLLADCFNLPKFLFALGGVIAFFCYLMMKFLNTRLIPLYRNPLYLPFGLFVVWQFLCIFPATNKIAGISEISLHIVCACLMFIVPFILRKTTDVVRFARIIVISSALIAIYGIFQHYGFDFIRWDIKHSALSTLGRRNFAGEYLVLVIPWALFCFFTSQKKQRLVFASIFVLLMFHLFLTFTRASWIGFAFSMFTAALILLKIRIRPAMVLKYFAISMLLIFVVRANAGIFQFEPGTLKSRIEIWKTSLSMIKEQPIIGYGTGNFEIAYYKFAHSHPDVLIPANLRVTKAHNEFIEIAVENGIVGLGSFLFFIFAIYKMAYQIFVSRNERPAEKFISVFVISGITGILVNALASFPLQITPGSFFFFLNCGILSRMYFTVCQVEAIEKKFYFPGVAFICMAVICSYIVFAFCAVNASYSLNQSKKIMRTVAETKDPVLWLVAEAYAKNSVNYNPFNVEGFFHLGKLYLVANQLEQARKNFLKALEFQPYSDQTIVNLGLVEQRSTNYQMAEKYFRKAISINPSNAEWFYLTGNFYLEKKDCDKAILYFTKSLELNPDNSQALFNLGQAYFEKGDVQRAKKVWQDLLQKEPSFYQAKKTLSSIP